MDDAVDKAMEDTRRLVRQIAAAAQSRSHRTVDNRETPPPTRSPNFKDQLHLDNGRTDLELKKKYGKGILWMLAGQMLVSNVFLFLYAWLGVEWEVPDRVIEFWLASTVVELIGLALVVTRYLFRTNSE